MSTGEGCAADCSDAVLTAYAKSTGFMNADNDITCDVWPATAPGQCSPGLQWKPKDESVSCRICKAASRVACQACDDDDDCNGEGCQMDACNPPRSIERGACTADEIGAMRIADCPGPPGAFGAPPAVPVANLSCMGAQGA